MLMRTRIFTNRVNNLESPKEKRLVGNFRWKIGLTFAILLLGMVNLKSQCTSPSVYNGYNYGCDVSKYTMLANSTNGCINWWGYDAMHVYNNSPAYRLENLTAGTYRMTVTYGTSDKVNFQTYVKNR